MSLCFSVVQASSVVNLIHHVLALQAQKQDQFIKLAQAMMRVSVNFYKQRHKLLKQLEDQAKRSAKIPAREGLARL
jgi:uncharacterized tellurite resistance protein B-like protein